MKIFHFLLRAPAHHKLLQHLNMFDPSCHKANVNTGDVSLFHNHKLDLHMLN